MAKHMGEKSSLRNFVTGKTYVFIDAANIFYAQRSLGWRVSYQRLMEHLKREVDLGSRQTSRETCYHYFNPRARVN